MKKTILQSLGFADSHCHMLLQQDVVERLIALEIGAYDPRDPEQTAKTAMLTYSVKPEEKITLSNPEMTLLAEDYITDSLVNAQLLTDLIDIDPAALLIKIVASSGDIRITYKASSTPVKDGMGEPLLYGGWIEVNKRLAQDIKVIQNSVAAAKLHITQYGRG